MDRGFQIIVVEHQLTICNTLFGIYASAGCNTIILSGLGAKLFQVVTERAINILQLYTNIGTPNMALYV